MNPWIGWLIALGGLAAGWASYGWRGLALAATVLAFLMLVQFNRVVRVMRNAAASPIGHVTSAVMLQVKLAVGQPMMQIVKQTKSLGARADGPAEVYTWTDAGGDAVTITFVDGRVASWALTRSADVPATDSASA